MCLNLIKHKNEFRFFFSLKNYYYPLTIFWAICICKSKFNSIFRTLNIYLFSKGFGFFFFNSRFAYFVKISVSDFVKESE